MKYSENTSSYNERRYSRPWIALVTFDTASKANFKFGTWIGELGYKGVLEIDAEPGNIVAKGQKDNRKPRNSAPDYYIMGEDGELSPVSKADAYKHYRVIENAMPSREELLAKKAELTEKLQFVELMLNKLDN